MNEEENTSYAEAVGVVAGDAEAQQAFVSANAEYFAQALAPLNQIFNSSGSMNIVCEEGEFTIVVGMRTVGEEGVLDVDCAMLESDQESLKDCINSLFI